jgi:hypothetical protein
MRWLDRLFSSKAEPTPEAAGGGVLFGLDPPPGCQFDVSASPADWWHVEIVGPGVSDLGVRSAYKVYWAGSDKEAIICAAKQALACHARNQGMADLIGLYPPKRTP